MNKDAQRQNLKKIRSELSGKEDLNKKILANLFACKEFINASSILAYYPLVNEIDTIPILNYAIENNITISLPVSFESPIMKFFNIDSLNDLQLGKFSIKEPKQEHETVVCKNSVCIVPAISFDKNGYRLGYGKGYYDYFLKDFPGTKIGLCYSALLTDKLYTEIHDIPMDIIVTEKSVYHLR